MQSVLLNTTVHKEAQLFCCKVWITLAGITQRLQPSIILVKKETTTYIALEKRNNDSVLSEMQAEL